MIYCDCDGEDDERFPTLAMQVGSNNLKHWFYLKGRDYLYFSVKR